MTSSESGTPLAAVNAWWTAWHRKDRAMLEQMMLADYIEYAGAGSARTIGAERLLEVADRYFAQATISDRSLEAIDVRKHMDVAICSYAWSERGRSPFDAQGLATDALARVDGVWGYQAHHVSILEAA
jgi:hypothetical protein